MYEKVGLRIFQSYILNTILLFFPRVFLRSSYRPSETEPTTTHTSPVVGSTATAAAVVTATPSVGTYTVNYYCNHTRFLTHQMLHSGVFSSPLDLAAGLPYPSAPLPPLSLFRLSLSLFRLLHLCKYNCSARHYIGVLDLRVSA